MAFSPDGKVLAVANRYGEVTLLELDTGRRPALEGHGGEVHTLAAAPQGRKLATGSFDRTIKLWDMATGKEITTFEGHKSSVDSVAFSPDGKLLGSGSNDRTVKLWDLATGRELTTIGFGGSVSSVAFSPDSKTLAVVVYPALIKLVEVATTIERNSVKESAGKITGMAFSPDGKFLATSNNFLPVKLWDVTTMQAVLTIQGSSGQVRCLAFAPDGKTLALGCGNTPHLVYSPAGWVELWDLSTAKLVSRFKAHNRWVTSVAYSPDGKRLATGGADHAVNLWRVHQE
jgi:WD40 repeat protein